MKNKILKAVTGVAVCLMLTMTISTVKLNKNVQNAEPNSHSYIFQVNMEMPHG